MEFFLTTTIVFLFIFGVFYGIPFLHKIIIKPLLKFKSNIIGDNFDTELKFLLIIIFLIFVYNALEDDTRKNFPQL